MKHHTVDANGIKLHVAEMGEGPAVILCHGWPETWYSWRHQLPALAAAGFRVLAPDMRGYGRSDRPEPIEPDTPFVIASVTKTFTATAMMRLVASQQVDLDAPVQRYLPDFAVADRSASAEITVLNLLNHTAGLDWRSPDQPDESDGALASYVSALRDQKLIAAPGERVSYSQSGYNVAGRVIEVVTGMTYEQAIAALLLEPLALRHSTFAPLPAITEPVARCALPSRGEMQLASSFGQRLGAALRELELLTDLAAEARNGRLRVPLAELSAAGIEPEAVRQLPWPPGLIDLLAARHSRLRAELAACFALLSPAHQPALRGLLVWAVLAQRQSLRTSHALPATAPTTGASRLADTWQGWRAARRAEVGRLALHSESSR